MPQQSQQVSRLLGRILFEDDDLILVDKPPRLPSQPTLDPNRDNLVRWLYDYLGAAHYVGQHHRLDADTSGVMLFSKTPRVNANLGRQFHDRLAKKSYLAVIGNTENLKHRGPWIVSNHLKDFKGRVKSVRSGGDRAETEFEVLHRSAHTALISARPSTGRRHQIRVHLSEEGLPILGDRTYGDSATEKAAPRQLLHAAQLEFLHPVTNEPLCIKASIPEDFKKVMRETGLDAPL